jgi:hypothetical protein
MAAKHREMRAKRRRSFPGFLVLTVSDVIAATLRGDFELESGATQRYAKHGEKYTRERVPRRTGVGVTGKSTLRERQGAVEGGIRRGKPPGG